MRIIRDGWRSEEVKDSLDLCLACKGCKSDCPVSVDVATYKAEFLSHYYEGRVRPLNAYAFGNIDLWARLASNAPGLVNLTTQLPFLRDVAKLAAGIPQQRSIPAFAPETFKSWFHRRENSSWRDGRIRPSRDAKQAPSGMGTRYNVPRTDMSNSAPWKSGASAPRQEREESRALAPEVLLWADTFNNYFLPETAKAAVEVLESAGYRVIVPQANLCCGRPLYDFGMLDRAEKLLLANSRRTLPRNRSRNPRRRTRTQLRRRLSRRAPQPLSARRTRTKAGTANVPAQRIPRATIPAALRCLSFDRKALLHGHCHHKSIMKMTAEESLLRRIGIDFQSPAPGCCGMAGSFGFEHDKYEISAAIGELELLPAVRSAPADWLIIADGFSCREQIAQGTARRALHLAEVLQMALASTSCTTAARLRSPNPGSCASAMPGSAPP